MRYVKTKKRKKRLWAVPFLIIGWCLIVILANMYNNIEVEDSYTADKLATESTYSEKTVQNQTEKSEESEDITDVLENVNNTVVGIS